MDTETFSPALAARQIGIPSNTLRNWCKVYGEFLSPSANPATGEQRRLTLGDIETLRAVAALRANDLPPETIISRLRANPSGITESLPKPPQAATIAPGDVAALPAVGNDVAPAHDAIQAFLARTEALDKLTDIDRRLERVESQRSTVLIAVACFVGGGVFVAVVAWLASIVR